MDGPSVSDQRITARLRAELASIPVPPRSPVRKLSGSPIGLPALVTIGLLLIAAVVGVPPLLRLVTVVAGSAGRPVEAVAGSHCPVTTTHDGGGVVVSSGDLGLIEVRPGTFRDEQTIVLVRRGAATGQDLDLRAVAVARDAGQVMWSVPTTARVTAWGTVVYEANTKPLGNVGCWRITRATAPPDDPGIVVYLGQ